MTSAGLVSQNLAGSARRVEVAGTILEYGWGPDGSLAYTAETGSLNDNGELVIRPAHGASTTQELGVGVGFPWPDWQSKVEFSPDGKLVLAVQFGNGPPAGAQSPFSPLQVRRLDGILVFAPQGPANPGLWSAGCLDISMAAWDPDGKLYFCDNRGINVADMNTGTVRTLQAGALWSDADVSPDGSYVVFPTGTVHNVSTEPIGIRPGPLELLDTKTGAPVAGFQRANGTLAHFVSPTNIWFYDVTAGGESAHLSTPILAYDFSTHTESKTGLTGWVTDIQLTR